MTTLEPTRCAALLLDMDGTLVDSHAAVEAMWSLWAREHGVDASAVITFCHGQAVASTIRHFLPDVDDESVEAMATLQLDRECAQLDGVCPADGAHELLAWADHVGLPWAVVTNSPARLAHARLGAAGIRPETLITYDDVPRGKPAPDGYLLAAGRLGVDPARAVAVEDSASGLAAARAAGTIVAAVGGATDADIVCAGLVDLHERLRELIQREAF